MIILFSRYSSFMMLLILLDITVSLELIALRVPPQVLVGSRPTLLCNWTLAPNDTLYSVKWYKDGKEFFRHVPRDVEPWRKFQLPGVYVEEFDVSGYNLTLTPAILETSGRYRCEVSGEKPRFHTVSEYADMLVIALPTHGPAISGFKSHYSLGDHVKVNCTSGRSKPAVELAWYINGEPASSVVAPPIIIKDDELETTILGIEFKIEEQHLMTNLRLKCLATLSSIYWRSIEENAVVSRSVQNGSKQDTQRVYSLSSTVRIRTDFFHCPLCSILCFILSNLLTL